ncbi:M23 family metallopeptidase [Candidatus Synechococcus calcipolaris G9]|uniref:M23 family metallopeptidase n=1 Tax=Candidatus Synechococcus calcipolaris G9 TaxID=1497997 RepID=A0ABT6EYU8_9SYNE|nr:M23 family metallopeptidase [Candidatus Synechococcus calcipolaris]MDG2990393.1 M23 family metallopeptidase [Candidatus Synechococcus calcipolaris G9]
MHGCDQYLRLFIILGVVGTGLVLGGQSTVACPVPILERLTAYQWRGGDRLETVAQAHGLRPVTLLGLNPVLRQGTVSVGTTIVIPPMDGVLIQRSRQESLPDIAQRYGIRPDVLFEVNGCQANSPTLFIPGVRWSEQGAVRQNQPIAELVTTPLQRYPLGAIAPTIPDRPDGQTSAMPTGVRFQISTPASIYAVAAGTVAFVGDRPGYGSLIVINHAQGWQTRYSSVQNIRVRVGQSVQAGTSLGQTGEQGLYFELRQNSPQGWVARDPLPYLSLLGAPPSQGRP